MQTFNYLQEHILENDTVRLDPLHNQDFDKLVHFSEQAPELWKYSFCLANDLENLKTYIDFALKGRKEETSYPFIIFDRSAQNITGSTRFYDFRKIHTTVQLGYTWYGKKFQGTGLNKQYKLLMLEFTFEKLDLDRVEFRADTKNRRSIAAMKSISCTVEGILRNNCAALDGRPDSIVLSILKDEWFGSAREYN